MKLFFILIAGLLVLVISYQVSNLNAKQGFLVYLKKHHKNKYKVLTFKRNFNTANMNPNLFWVALELKENPDIVITFEWNAKLKALHIPYHYRENLSIESLTHYQQEAIIVNEDLLNALKKHVLECDVNVFNHSIDITLEEEPTLKDFQHFSTLTSGVIDKYPNTWTYEAHVNFKTEKETKGFYQLIVKTRMQDGNNDAYQYRPNAIIANNYGSIKAENIQNIIQQEFSKPNAPAYLNNIWINQKQLDSFFIAIEKHEPLIDIENKNNLTKGVGIYFIEMVYPHLKGDSLTYYDYKTIPRDEMYSHLLNKLPDDYHYLT